MKPSKWTYAGIFTETAGMILIVWGISSGSFGITVPGIILVIIGLPVMMYGLLSSARNQARDAWNNATSASGERSTTSDAPEDASMDGGGSNADVAGASDGDGGADGASA